MSDVDLLVAASRQMFAFSRDGALPFSSVLYKVHPLTGTPIYCVFASAFCAMILGLLSFAGPVAIGAVFTMGIICQYLAYSAPIAARFLGGQAFTPGPFSLRSMGLPVAATALLFMAFMIIILFFPAEPGPTADDMNYSIVVVGGVLVLSTLYYHFPRYGGKHWFKGPLANVNTSRKGDESVEEDEKVL
jgi:amino acid transporter